MARTSFASVDDYIAAQPVASQRVLRRVRPPSEPVPVKVIEAVARQRAEEAAGSEGTRSTRKKR